MPVRVRARANNCCRWATNQEATFLPRASPTDACPLTATCVGSAKAQLAVRGERTKTPFTHLWGLGNARCALFSVLGKNMWCHFKTPRCDIVAYINAIRERAFVDTTTTPWWPHVPNDDDVSSRSRSGDLRFALRVPHSHIFMSKPPWSYNKAEAEQKSDMKNIFLYY